jgi:hypothetical protein
MATYPSAIELSDLDGKNEFQISGKKHDSRNGYSVATAGDLNGNGFDDIIVGEPHVTNGSPGASYVVFGKASGFGANFKLSNLAGVNGFKVRGETSSKQYLAAVADRGAYASAMRQFMENRDLILLPTMPIPAFAAGRSPEAGEAELGCAEDP